MTDTEELVDLARRENELACFRNKTLVKRCMDIHPQCAELLVRTLRSNGYDLSVALVVESAKASPGEKSRRATAQEIRLETMRADSHATAAEEMKGQAKDWVPSKYWTIEQLSYSLLVSHVLTQVEPQSLSGANLRSIRVGGTQVSTKGMMLQLFQYTTGLPVEFSLNGPLRYWPYLQAYLRYQAASRGRRSQSLLLPAAWSHHLDSPGVYAAVVTSKIVTITHTWTLVEIKLAKSLVKPRDENDVIIEANWSESNALMKLLSVPVWPGELLAKYFSNHVSDANIPIPDVPREAHRPVCKALGDKTASPMASLFRALALSLPSSSAVTPRRSRPSPTPRPRCLSSCCTRRRRQRSSPAVTPRQT